MSTWDWDRMESSWWATVRDTLPRPWPREACYFDLRWWDSRERQYEGTEGQQGHRRRPGRGDLARTWGWSDRLARKLMSATSTWVDPFHGDRRAKEEEEGGEDDAGPAAVQNRSSFGPVAVQKDDAKLLKLQHERSSAGPAPVQSRSSFGPHARSFLDNYDHDLQHTHSDTSSSSEESDHESPTCPGPTDRDDEPVTRQSGPAPGPLPGTRTGIAPGGDEAQGAPRRQHPGDGRLLRRGPLPAEGGEGLDQAAQTQGTQPPAPDGLTPGQWSVLRAAGIASLDALEALCPSELLRRPGVGPATLRAAQAALRSSNRQMVADPPPRSRDEDPTHKMASDAFAVAWMAVHGAKYAWDLGVGGRDRDRRARLAIIAGVDGERPETRTRLEAVAEQYLLDHKAGRAWPKNESTGFACFVHVAQEYMSRPLQRAGGTVPPRKVATVDPVEAYRADLMKWVISGDSPRPRIPAGMSTVDAGTYLRECELVAKCSSSVCAGVQQRLDDARGQMRGQP